MNVFKMHGLATASLSVVLAHHFHPQSGMSGDYCEYAIKQRDRVVRSNDVNKLKVRYIGPREQRKSRKLQLHTRAALCHSPFHIRRSMCDRNLLLHLAHF